ncbi:hypothetical protein CLPUN_38010 [Clostridium puniceum]|uniref:Spo0E like sporulation regulatory protein n=1 Tax=Clostridium puniceum TaxID=29367 RepID=A0A1S8T9U6_9CLOT|nr:Spo0E family sporulation regulatory protein-aspartic acid phosphatase [Clostridium puniceum]OOM74560.1 hypothetical protein CLPUN_38010 [Clostridium puniceum]
MTGFMVRCKAKDIGEAITNHFKNNLNNYLEVNATLNNESIRLSQELDNLIVREQRKKVTY